ncbi:GGDEF domain-containing protein [Sulfurospirillum oryzae]|uniref:GGDEF domain-containing protein n=1 Tax=Sulfurospirillum oryzae TaxID=2976535 RepID=UPI0021E91602|nr:GGDEF domain-containing protein [Sulfurospirillum oryzae]
MAEYSCISIITIACTVLCIICFVLVKIIYHQKRQVMDLHLLTQKDELTQAYTRRYFCEILEYHLKLIQRYNNSSAVLMIDIDNFKEINDTFGHPFGDNVLIQVVRECNHALRESDVIARYGGDEFILLCPLITHEDLIIIAQRVQNALRDFQGVPITLSVGACLFEKTFSASHIIHSADKALYNAKKNGKDRIEFLIP